MIWSVPKDAWKGATCIIIAGGPSLQGFDPELLRFKRYSLETGREVRLIAINDSWRLAPWAEVLYFCDGTWWDRQQADNPRSYNGAYGFHDMIYAGFWVTTSQRFRDHPQVHTLRLSGQLGLETDPAALKHGSNSGYQAINLAYHYGAKKIILLGYDMRADAKGRTHWHNEERPDDFVKIMEQSMLPCFPSLVDPLVDAGVEVINATPASALKVWPQVPFLKALA